MGIVHRGLAFLTLGDAVLAQQADVMDAIQRLGAKADANNKLASSKQQTVTKSRGQGGRQVIAIEQTDRYTLYMPYCDPNIVYGAWPYPESIRCQSSSMRASCKAGSRKRSDRSMRKLCGARMH